MPRSLKMPDGRIIEVTCQESDVPIIAEQLKYTDWKDWSDAKLKSRVVAVLQALKLTRSADDVLDWNDGEEDYYNWVVPDLLEAGDRLVLTGTEGTGKSTLIMQWLVQISAGIHPLTGQDIEPRKALLIDLEYGMSELSRRLLHFEKLAGDRWQPDKLRIISKPEGWDLTVPGNREQLMTVMDIWGPEVVAISPLYKSFEGDETDDVVANKVTEVLNGVRDLEAVVIVEAHVPHAGPSGRRPERPIGSSVWTRWPEFGIFLAKNGELRHFRGARDAEREWPAALHRRGAWPWTAIDPEVGEDLRWKKLRRWAVENNKRPTTRQAAEVLAVSQATASRVMKDHTNDWPDFSDSSDSR